MIDLARAAAIVLAAVFVLAAVAKGRDQPSTVASFRGLRLPAPGFMAKVVPLVEVGVAVGMIVAPATSAGPALVLLVAFSAVIARAVAAGSTVSCACFGGGARGASEDRPVSTVELVRNAGLGALAIVASGAGEGSALWPSLPAVVIVTVVVALVRIAFGAVELRRLGGHVFSTPLPGERSR